MQTVLIAITMADAAHTVSFMRFIVDDGRGIKQEPTAENIQRLIDEAFRLRPEQPASWRIISEAELPDCSCPYRNALRDSGKHFQHDMSHAREIHRARLRFAREPHLAQLDVEYQRADERGDKKGKVSVTEQKQRLRDLPSNPRIAAAGSVEELKAAWPDYLA